MTTEIFDGESIRQIAPLATWPAIDSEELKQLVADVCERVESSKDFVLDLGKFHLLRTTDGQLSFSTSPGVILSDGETRVMNILLTAATGQDWFNQMRSAAAKSREEIAEVGAIDEA